MEVAPWCYKCMGSIGMDGCPGGVKYRAINNNGAINKWLLNYIQKETFFLNFQLRQKNWFKTSRMNKRTKKWASSPKLDLKCIFLKCHSTTVDMKS